MTRTTDDILRASDFVVEYDAITTRDVDSTTTLLFASISSEDRGKHPIWDEALRTRPNECVALRQADDIYSVVAETAGMATTIRLRHSDVLASTLARGRRALLDISGLAHQIWAPIVASFIRTGLPLQVMYVEPESYKTQLAPSAAADSFDLSSGFEGVRPLPGFERIGRRIRGPRHIYVPMLGFEGTRPKYLLNDLSGEADVVPILGLPGFRADFPTVAASANSLFLSETHSHSKIRYARGSCPFDAFAVISEVRSSEQADHLTIAPVGTKPHALGAILYACKHMSSVELLYDHPIRRPNRTAGIGRTHIYDVSGFSRSAAVARW